MRRGWNRLFDLTGFRGKTLWDLLGLLVVPAVLALGGWWLSDASARNQQQIETDRAQQTILQSYIENMTALLLDRKLADSVPDDPIRDIARSSTLAAVRQLDGERKGILLEFLSESNLVIRSSIDPIISLSGADLFDANLFGADLPGADLFDANVSWADLGHANLSSAHLPGADLSFADLSSARLIDTNLELANLPGADLTDANLTDADLSGANLRDANLRSANGWNNKQLARAESLVGATMPDGTVMTEEAWEEFTNRYR
jgi:uncharacterized protein YjbI with pentapeptide repeats